MPAKKKKATKTKVKVKVKDLKAKKNPKGGTPGVLGQARDVTIGGLQIPAHR